MIVDDLRTCKEHYGIIYADPPWRQSKGGKKAVRQNSSGVPLEYPTMSLQDIYGCLLAANELTGDNAVLFLWTIDKYLFDAQRIAEAIGYKLHARMVWDKVTGIPAAFTIRFGHEYLLWMYKGKLMPIERSERGKIHSVFREKVRRHSQKPEIAYQIIERLYPHEKKLEMFARNTRAGWDSWGNEI